MEQLFVRADLPRIDRDAGALPDVLIDSWDADPPTVLRPVFDVFWQSGGVSGSPSYDAAGNWRESSSLGSSRRGR
jgi:hypothetical protein